MLTNNFGNMCFTWNTLNILMNHQAKKIFPNYILWNDSDVYDDEKIADIFSDYYSNVPLQLNANILNTNLDPISNVNVNLNTVLLEFEFLTSLEIFSVIEHLKVTKQDKNSVTIRLVKANNDFLSITINRMINQSLSDGVFPDDLK